MEEQESVMTSIIDSICGEEDSPKCEAILEPQPEFILPYITGASLYLNASPDAKKGAKRKTLTLEERIRVLQQRESGVSERKLAEIFKCSKTQINTTVKNKKELLKEYEECRNWGMKRRRKEKYRDVNEAVLQWSRYAKFKKIPLNGTLVKEKAIQIAGAMGVNNFCASNGWLDKFCQRHNLVFKSSSGSLGETDEVCEDWNMRLPWILMGYEDHNIYNMDETGLFFRTLPTKNLLQKAESAKRGEISKERLTVAFCVNAVGEKERPIVIGKLDKPRCFKNADESEMCVTWKPNKKAWMTSPIFEEWLLDFDKRMTTQERKVILILDNAPCHVHDSKLQSVKLQFVPLNTPKIQPLHHGIIQSFKLEYCRLLLHRLVSSIDSSTNAAEASKIINASDAILWIQKAWENVMSEVIVKSFIDCGLSNATIDKPLDDISFLKEEIIKLAKAAEVDYDPKFHEYEETIECYEEMSGDWVNRFLGNARTGAVSDSEDESPPPKEISYQETLRTVNKLIESSVAVENDEKVRFMFNEVRECLEKKIVKERLLKHKKNIYSYVF